MSTPTPAEMLSEMRDEAQRLRAHSDLLRAESAKKLEAAIALERQVRRFSAKPGEAKTMTIATARDMVDAVTAEMNGQFRPDEVQSAVERRFGKKPALNTVVTYLSKLMSVRRVGRGTFARVDR